MGDLYKNRKDCNSQSSAFFNQIILDKKILKKLNLSSESKVLDVGCGVGNNIKTLLKYFNRIDAFDISSAAIEFAKDRFKNYNINFFVFSIEQIELKNKYDVIICTEVLEHVVNIEKVISKLNTMLYKGGIIIISTPSYLNLTGIIKLYKDKKFGKNIWEPWGAHLNGRENFVTGLKIKKIISINNFVQLYTIGADYITSFCVPYSISYKIFRRANCLLYLLNLPIIKEMAMNYFIVARKKYE